MSEPLAVDSNAVIEWFRTGNMEPPPLWNAHHIMVPLPVVGELYAGAFASLRRTANLAKVETFVATYETLHPSAETARLYGQLRAHLQLTNIRQSKSNDVWIAALAIQHSLPLLTNDRGFDIFPELRTIHW